MSELVSQFPALPKFHLSCRGLKLNILQEKTTKSVFGQLKAAIRGNDDEESSGGKRWIVVKRSTPFSAEKQEKPMNTFAFTEIYQSESFEGLQSVNGIYPNLVATIPACAAGEDINLFVSVWIESSAVNSGKQSTLASCFVSVRQVYKGAMEGGLITPDDLSKIHHYTHIMHMKSEYCKDPFMALNVITLATDITLQSSSCVRPYAPARTPPPLHTPDITPGEKAIEKPDKALVAASMPNPLQQQYVLCSIVLPSSLGLSLSLSLSYPCFAACLHSLTPYDTGLTIIPIHQSTQYSLSLLIVTLQVCVFQPEGEYGNPDYLRGRACVRAENRHFSAYYVPRQRVQVIELVIT